MISIRQAVFEDGPTIVEIYRECLRQRMPVWSQQPIERQVNVAEHDGEVVGLGGFTVIDTVPYSGLAHLLAAMEPSMRGRLFPYGLKAYGINIEAPPELRITQQRGDWVFTALAVRPDARRRGIGTALALERLRAAREAGATKVFVQTLDAGGSRQLYEKLGFVPLVRMSEVSDAPSDATAMSLLCAVLL